MAKADKAATCPDCGGAARGRGFTHKETCPSFKSKGAGTGTRAGARGGEGVSLATLRAMDAERLLELQTDVAAILKEKAPELEARMAALGAALKVIKGR